MNHAVHGESFGVRTGSHEVPRCRSPSVRFHECAAGEVADRGSAPDGVEETGADPAQPVGRARDIQPAQHDGVAEQAAMNEPVKRPPGGLRAGGESGFATTTYAEGQRGVMPVYPIGTGISHGELSLRNWTSIREPGVSVQAD
jgi:hypothetical protein